MCFDSFVQNENSLSGRQVSKKWLAVLCLVFYMLLLTLASLMPVAKNSALAATEMRRMLNNLLHVPAYTVLVLAWVVFIDIWTVRVSRLKTVLVAICVAIVYGGLLEMAQMWVPGRMPSSGDLLLNVAGAVCGGACVFFWKRHSGSSYE